MLLESFQPSSSFWEICKCENAATKRNHSRKECRVETVNRDYKGSDNQTNISPRTILCQSLVKSYRQRWSKKSCPRLRELASLRPEALERGITQPRAHFFGPIYTVGIFVKSLSNRRIKAGKADDFVVGVAFPALILNLTTYKLISRRFSLDFGALSVDVMQPTRGPCKG